MLRYHNPSALGSNYQGRQLFVFQKDAAQFSILGQLNHHTGLFTFKELRPLPYTPEQLFPMAGGFLCDKPVELIDAMCDIRWGVTISDKTCFTHPEAPLPDRVTDALQKYFALQRLAPIGDNGKLPVGDCLVTYLA